MNRALARWIVDYLFQSGERGESLAPLEALSRRRWEQVVKWLDISGLTLMFWDQITKLDHKHLAPLEIRGQLDRNLADNRQRVAEMAREFDSINRCLESAAVEYAVLKGFALFPDYCPDLGLRSFYDYDYFVRPGSLEKADGALRGAGYVRKETRSSELHAVYDRPSRPWYKPVPRDDLYSPNFPRRLELHSKLWPSEQFKIPLRMSWDTWAAPRRRSWQGFYFYSLSEEDELLFHLLHGFRHILGYWCRLAWLLEIAHFVKCRSQDVEFWLRFCKCIGENERLADIVGVVFSLIEAVFPVTLPPTIQELTQRCRPSLALWVAHFGRESALEHFAGSKNSLFLYREFVQYPEDWRAIRHKYLFAWRRPPLVAQSSSPRAAGRAKAALRQGVYIARRLVFHLKSAILYAWASYRWRQILSRGR